MRPPASRPFGPKKDDHPSVNQDCPACNKPFKAGDYTTLVALGPGDSDENQRKAREGCAYNAVALEVHWTCGTGLPDPKTPEELERLQQ